MLGGEELELDTLGEREAGFVTVPAGCEEGDDLPGAVLVAGLEQLGQRGGGESGFSIEFADDRGGRGLARVAAASQEASSRRARRSVGVPSVWWAVA